MSRMWKTSLAVAVSGLLLTFTAVTPAEAGRYKKGPNGECVRDANDNGPDQCQPPKDTGGNKGRFKKDGNRCYWDANDSGPNQCRP